MKISRFLIPLTFSLVANLGLAQNEPFILNDGGAKINFVAKPTEQTQTVPTKIGNLKMHAYALNMEDGSGDANTLYVYNRLVYPEGSLDKFSKGEIEAFFNGLFNGASSTLGGSVETQKKFDFPNHPAREAKISILDGEATLTMRAILVGSTVYTMQVMTETSNYPNPDITKFLDSFELLK